MTSSRNTACFLLFEIKFTPVYLIKHMSIIIQKSPKKIGQITHFSVLTYTFFEATIYMYQPDTQTL